MDDFEKKELENEELANTEDLDSSAPSAEEQPSAEDELVKELEEIRDMFQEAIDNAGQQQKAEGELIQELDEFSDEQEEASQLPEQDLPLCDCCGEAPVSTQFGEGYPYCDSCRELMKRYPLRIGGVIALITMVVVFCACAFFSVDSLDKAIVVLEARTAAGENKMMSTVQTLYSFTSNTKTDSKKAVELLVDGFMRTGYINNAKEIIEEYYTVDELNRPGNKEYKQILEFVDNFLETRESTQLIVSDAFSGADFDYDKLIAELDAAKEKFIDEEKGIKYNFALIEYYKYELMRLTDVDLEKQLETLKAIEAEDKKGFAEWIYVPSICEVAGKMGNKEMAEEYFEKMKKINSEDMKAYNSFALYYRYLETPDADAMLALCQQAEENAYSGDYSYYPTMAIAYLIKGEGALALDTMTQYMNSSYYTVSNCNLYALCALYCGDKDIYENMVSTLKSSGFELSDLVVKYKNDKLSIDEVLADKRGNIG